MRNALKIIKGSVALSIVAFIAIVIWGVFTALNAAPLSSAPALERAAGDVAIPDKSESEVDHAIPHESDSYGAEDNSGGFDLDTPKTDSNVENELPAPASSASSNPAPSTESSSPAAASKDNSGSTSRAGTNSENSAGSTPTPSAPQRTWHPAWDEWVSEGHFETKTIPATYGKREVYGSICRECSANISGRANQHLKDTHHSGFYEGVVGHESYEITPERIEQIWVNTSHWVAHPGYWE